MSPIPARVVVVGGANTDIVGLPVSALVARDSNPGHVRRSPGGVARNVAENLARLGIPVSLVSAFGTDPSGTSLAAECEAERIDVSASLSVDDVPGSIYLAILDHRGDMSVAINDMRAVDRITPDALAERHALLGSAELIVLDANLPAASLEWIAENTSVPLLVDTTSHAKAPRVRGMLSHIGVLKVNALEAGTLVDREIHDSRLAEKAARELIALGAGRVFVTLGARGVIAADENHCIHMTPPHVTVANATGAGDAFSAGLALATLEGMGLAESAAWGLAMAALALESDRTVSELISRQTAGALVKEIA
jgi:pseudouridine kinase